MKYTLHQFQQQACFELNLNLQEAYLLSWIVDFIQSGNMDSIILEGEPYYWIAYSKVIDELPMLRIQSMDVVGRKFKSLEKKKILKRHTVKTAGKTKCYFAIVKETYKQLFMREEVDSRRVRGVAADESGGSQPTEQSDNSSIIDSSIIDSNIYDVDTPDDTTVDNLPDTDAESITDCLISNLLDYNPAYTSQVPKKGTELYNKWLKQTRLLIDKDKACFDDIMDVVDWIKDYEGNNGFTWINNIRSTKKLRDKFPQLLGQMKQDKKSKDKGMLAVEKYRKVLDKESDNGIDDFNPFE